MIPSNSRDVAMPEADHTSQMFGQWLCLWSAQLHDPFTGREEKVRVVTRQSGTKINLSAYYEKRLSEEQVVLSNTGISCTTSSTYVI
jgi:hypothetical protein